MKKLTGKISTKQVILDKKIVVDLLYDCNFNNINDYIHHMKNVHGLSPYKKDIKKSEYKSGLGENKMNHYSIKPGLVERYRYYITNKKKWFLTKINHGI